MGSLIFSIPPPFFMQQYISHRKYLRIETLNMWEAILYSLKIKYDSIDLSYLIWYECLLKEQPDKYVPDPNIHAECLYHVAFCTKYKKPMLVGGMYEELRNILHSTAESLGCRINTMKIDPFMVEMRIECNNLQLGIHRVIKTLKASSYTKLNERFSVRKKLPSLWTNEYYIATIGQYNPLAVQNFVETRAIRNQRKKKELD